MMSVKDALIAFVQSLPDDVTFPDAVCAIDDRFGLSDEDYDDVWIEEINRRVADAEAGRTVGIPHDEVMRKMREKYG